MLFVVVVMQTAQITSIGKLLEVSNLQTVIWLVGSFSFNGDSNRNQVTSYTQKIGKNLIFWVSYTYSLPVQVVT